MNKGQSNTIVKFFDGKALRCQRLKQTLSLLATFYVSYLFLHFVILEITPIDSPFVIVAVIWGGHVLLNVATIAMMQKQTFGDLIFRLHYIAIAKQEDSCVARKLLIRSLVSTNALYLLIILNIQLRFSMDVLLGSFCFGVFLLLFPVRQQAHQSANLLDWISGTKTMFPGLKNKPFTKITARVLRAK
ncbi:hypothetical protein DRW07_13375 [Alteromonas sediminis]|uniref:Uncharacterized protein n=1 Tax=Alteromonas sediminis TaxID=2259342 RepID=A0A3N5Y631_9ALTE|nr:hypothetical protein [Alteromonas sediminis]RPJ65799.1 hypothetical protein DRW07_13375 [Alteromonas sediminis]